MGRRKKLPAGFTRRKDGTLQYAFMIDGSRYYVYAASVEECEKKRDEIRDKLKQGLSLKDGTITLHGYYERWQARRIKSGQVKPSTVYANNRRYARIDKVLGKKKLTAIKKDDVYRLQADLVKDLSSKGTNDTIALLKSILKSAADEDIIPKNPADGVKSIKRTEEEAAKNTHRYLSGDEITAFFEAAAGSIYKNLFLFLLLSGMRCGEAGALTWADIDEENNVIHITKSVTRISNTEFVIGSTKTQDSKRDIELTDELRSVLASQRIQQAGLFGIRAVKDEQQIFTTTTGELINQSNTCPVITNICKKAGAAGRHIDRFTPHAFRHTFITYELENGVPMNDIAKQVGHTNTITLQKYYSHEDPEKMKEAFRMVSRDMMKLVKIS